MISNLNLRRHWHNTATCTIRWHGMTIIWITMTQHEIINIRESDSKIIEHTSTHKFGSWAAGWVRVELLLPLSQPVFKLRNLWHVVTNTHKFWFRPWLWLWLSIEIIRVERYSQLWLKWMNPVFRVATGMHKRQTITTVKIRWKILTTWKLDYFDSDVRRRVV